MKSITFSEKEIVFLLEQYQSELKEAEEYADNLRNILDRLNLSEPSKNKGRKLVQSRWKI